MGRIARLQVDAAGLPVYEAGSILKDVYKRQREDGVMHDQQLIAELFTNTIKAARILGKDASWAKSLEGKLKSCLLYTSWNYSNISRKHWNRPKT